MKNILFIFILIICCYSEDVVGLEKGEKAPFEGVLVSTEKFREYMQTQVNFEQATLVLSNKEKQLLELNNMISFFETNITLYQNQYSAYEKLNLLYKEQYEKTQKRRKFEKALNIFENIGIAAISVGTTVGLYKLVQATR